MSESSPFSLTASSKRTRLPPGLLSESAVSSSFVSSILKREAAEASPR